ncbi:adenosylcobinamide-phosphate synthase CbiB [Pelagibacterium lacus]|uniref:Cobalamin biosynthesis protein CobD n=1 Tax=Pelagibacterium lacus TaxID=2282655 RepID=A0A369WD04_9HYPH|nr:adenosylcobinamide-phosphate synthase CbiB [Pelagibacterium lacus]RDE09981.1 cobalamin biosynthesis protein CobD [Pelagibacterium lacus]
MIALLAAVIERLVGYPAWLVDRIGHPVMWMGTLLDRFDRRYNTAERSYGARRARGVYAIAALVLAVLVIALGLQALLRLLPFGWVAEAVLASSLIAQKGLRDAVMAVADALRAEGIAGARTAVARIVGRDTSQLDEAGVSRAAIETLAENASDGVIAPLFYLALFGLPGAAVYKAINTADSMIGHRSERYAAFGWAAARIDDWANLIPARLTAALFAAAARSMPEADARAAWETARRDAPGHASPNAGWPEAALAGALGFGLGGPRSYEGEIVELPRMGQGRRILERADIEIAIRLYDRAMLLALAGLAVWALVLMVV